MSLIMRRNLMAERSGGGWKNPYVTDGLVAMWDCEWNAGGGKSDSQRRLVNLGDPSFAGDLVLAERTEFDGSEASLLGIGDDYVGGTARIYNSSVSIKTICAVCRFVSYRAGSNYQNSYFLIIPSCALGCRRNRTNDQIMFFNSDVTLYGYNNFSPVKLDPFSIVHKTSPWDYLSVNNVVKGRSNELSNRIDYEDVKILKPSSGDHYAIRTIRLYDKLLTDAEFAAIYAVDKARFDLP